eukprot:6187769-Pleurochrysis_carterae.AAC.1
MGTQKGASCALESHARGAPNPNTSQSRSHDPLGLYTSSGKRADARSKHVGKTESIRNHNPALAALSKSTAEMEGKTAYDSTVAHANQCSKEWAKYRSSRNCSQQPAAQKTTELLSREQLDYREEQPSIGQGMLRCLHEDKRADKDVRFGDILLELLVVGLVAQLLEDVTRALDRNARLRRGRQG